MGAVGIARCAPGTGGGGGGNIRIGCVCAHARTQCSDAPRSKRTPGITVLGRRAGELSSWWQSHVVAVGEGAGRKGGLGSARRDDEIKLARERIASLEGFAMPTDASLSRTTSVSPLERDSL